MPEKIFGVVFVFLICLIVFRMARKIAPSAGEKGARFDAGVVSVLKTRGDALNSERPVDVYLYLPTEAAAQQVATEIAADGFTIDRVGPEPKGNTFACQASKPMVPTLENVEVLRVKLEAIAAAHDGEYDGWGCAVIDG